MEEQIKQQEGDFYVVEEISQKEYDHRMMTIAKISDGKLRLDKSKPIREQLGWSRAK